jgi:hypothetical protein
MGGKLPLNNGRFLGDAGDQCQDDENASDCVEQGAVSNIAKRPTDHGEDSEQ